MLSIIFLNDGFVEVIWSNKDYFNSGLKEPVLGQDL